MSRAWGMFFGMETEQKILILGLDNAGKTTILYRLQLSEVVETVPTLGFNVETLEYKGVKLQVWDLGGQTTIRPFWRCYFLKTSALIFVIDSTDAERIEIAKEELALVLAEEGLEKVTLTVLANKQDLPNALSTEAISEALGLCDIKDRKWNIFPTSAHTGLGISDAFDWLANELTRR